MTRTEAELVDVHRGRGTPDVLEHRRVEARPANEHLRRRGAALGEGEREVSGARPARPRGARVRALGPSVRRPRSALRASASSVFRASQVGLALLLGHLGPAEVESLDRVDEDPGDEGLGEPLVVGGDDVPRRPGRRGGGERGLEGGHVLVPERPLGDVGRVELPLLAGRVEPGEEALLLLLLRDVEEELHDLRPVPVEVALEGVDVLVAFLPQRRAGVSRAAASAPRATPDARAARRPPRSASG